MKATVLTAAALAACSLAGCKEEGHVDTAKIAADIKAQEVQWMRDYNDRNVNAAVGHYTDDAVVAAPGEPLAAGTAERRKAIEALVGDPNFKLDFASDDQQVAKAGDMAYSRGHYTIQATDKATNKPVTGSGNYVVIFRKQDDGSWKAAADFITPGPVPAATPAAK
jgi:ketosteroid isomerase-like protein